ncbi:MAG: nickel pincer cofactor biosynthesis protein LarC [Jaaginema sp. PMC 1079.18]|nr:nickel pincer cofactor biosynthesis protein LarC [Jaaginema sp. PMC 1080.18]MEC4853873.1 nickel pincer cofactor biosynthesis protein LarC [Jaaginema sp. PMC 1079.18]MEC4865073.1 nickel pincer cofactor biosynthesis protein LarC [Jaaginema sp. PMC 1078.18]
MTKVAYLQCPTGIAGDMCLGALVDAGVPLDYLDSQLAKLGLTQEYQLRSEAVQRHNQAATQVHVDLGQPHHHHDHHHSRHLPDIEKLIKQANLPPQATQWSLDVFHHLAVAEGAVHGISPQEVHFHEVGATDAIVDIVGTCLGLAWLEIEQLYCSALPTGGGTVKAAHGLLPVPVPAVLRLWENRKVPTYHNGIEKELVTPTGAAIATTLAIEFGPPPAMQIQKIGFGAGTKDFSIPNILRLWLGNAIEPPVQDTVAVLETQIDDLSPQAIGYTFEALFAAGALDVFTQGINMKKSRPGILITVICPRDRLTACQTILFRETTTLGIRHRLQQRTILAREFHTVDTPYGTAQIKIAYQNSPKGRQILNIQPEYEDCARIAQTHNLPWREVQQIVLHTWQAQQRKD